MSVKHVKEYFNQVADQYSEMLNELRDFEKEAEQGLIEPERLDIIKQNIQPLVNNYQTLSWIMLDRKSTRLNSSHSTRSRMPSSA